MVFILLARITYRIILSFWIYLKFQMNNASKYVFLVVKVPYQFSRSGYTRWYITINNDIIHDNYPICHICDRYLLIFTH